MEVNPMNKTKRKYLKINLALGMVLIAVLTGCVGYVDGGYGGAVVEPDVTLYGGYGWGHWHDYDNRGHASWGGSHGWGGHGGGGHGGR
jgi:hypothetical protein